MRNRSDLKSVRRYLDAIDGYTPLSANEEINLAQRIRKGDAQALEKLVTANLRFVVTIANRYQGFGLPLQDLISEGNLGLIKAAQKFDPSRGFKFVSYAVWWIRQAIMMALGEHGRIVRLPLNRLNTMRKIERTADVLKQSLKREPSIEEIARNAEITMSEALNALIASTHNVSLDAPCRDDENLNLLNLLESDQHASPDASLLEESQQDEIERLISALTPREAEIVSMYFGLDGGTPLTLEQIGERLQLTRERVRQIKEQALRRLRRQASWEMVQKYRNHSQDYKNVQSFTAAAA